MMAHKKNPSLRDVKLVVEEMKSSEESKFESIDWFQDGYEMLTDDALLILGSTGKSVWFPLGQLRIVDEELFASNWILEQKNLG